jgi:hypothetical protein
MQKTKIKHDAPLSGRRAPFVVMSVVIAIIGMAIQSAFLATNPHRYLPFQQVQIAVFTIGLFPVLLQVLLIERFLKRSMRGWLVSTTIGTLITLLLLSTFTNWSDDSDTIQIVGFVTSFGPTIALQTFWLWRRFKKAWLWPLFIIFVEYNATGFLIRFGVNSVTQTIFGVLPIVTAAVQALILYYLLSHPRDTQKAKVDFATSHQSDEHERLEHLQDHERKQHKTLWDSADEQALQSEA